VDSNYAFYFGKNAGNEVANLVFGDFFQQGQTFESWASEFNGSQRSQFSFCEGNPSIEHFREVLIFADAEYQRLLLVVDPRNREQWGQVDAHGLGVEANILGSAERSENSLHAGRRQSLAHTRSSGARSRGDQESVDFQILMRWLHRNFSGGYEPRKRFFEGLFTTVRKCQNPLDHHVLVAASFESVRELGIALRTRGECNTRGG
jgi:hypothetical protein